MNGVIRNVGGRMSRSGCSAWCSLMALRSWLCYGNVIVTVMANMVARSLVVVHDRFSLFIMRRARTMSVVNYGVPLSVFSRTVRWMVGNV